MDSANGMTVALLAVGVLVLLIAVFVIIGLRRGPAAFYVPKTDFFSGAEADLYRRLETELGDGYRVLPRVGLTEILALKKRMSYRTRRLAWSRLADQRLDFLLLDGQTLIPVAAVIITGSTPSRRERRRHKLLSRLCEVAALPLLTVDPEDHADVGDLRRKTELQQGQPSELTPAPIDQSTRQEPRLSMS